MTIICRVCLASSEAKMYHRLSDVFPAYFNSSQSVLSILQTVMSVTVSTAPDYPYAICTACLKSLKECYTFITKFHQAQDTLKKKVENQLSLMLAKAEKEIILKNEPLDEDSVDPLLIESEPSIESPIKPVLKRKNVSTRKSNLGTAINKTNSQKNDIDIRILEHNYTKNPDYQEQDFNVYSEESSDGSEGTDDSNILETIKIINIKKDPKGNPSNNVVLMSVEDVLNLRQESQKIIPSTTKTQIRRKSQRRQRAKKGHNLHCSICSKSYSTQKGLLLHQYFHTPDCLEDLKGKECGYQCTTQSGAIHHCQKHDGNDDSNIVETIKIINTEEVPKDNPSNNVVLMSVEDILNLRQESEKIIPQTSKTKTFPSTTKAQIRRNSQRRQQAKKGENLHCSICSKSYSTQKGLLLHQYVHTPNYLEDLKCKECGYQCTTKSGSIHHRQKHDGNEYKCDECGKRVFSKWQVMEHKRRMHVGLPEKFMCSECGKRFKYNSALKYHMISAHHKEDKEYLCGFCGYKCVTKAYLKRHERCHTNERPYKCKLCPKAFRGSAELQLHQMAHEQKKRHYCKYCKKGFIATWNMKIHWLQHEGSHACELCSKSFADEFILKFHYFYRHRVRDQSQLKEKEQIVEVQDDTADDDELLLQ